MGFERSNLYENSLVIGILCHFLITRLLYNFHIPGDLFIGISTSGNSENVLRAVKVAEKCGAKTAALLGKDGGKIRSCVDYPVVVKSNTTARIQESHICIIHILCELVENIMTKG